ncbi:MAG: hypothetical protein R3C11_14755 [Planctomycetaceae bacterium]
MSLARHGWRLDHYLTRLHPNYFSSAFQRAIRIGAVCNGLSQKLLSLTRVNDRITVRIAGRTGQQYST